jgi:hypothetical protein
LHGKRGSFISFVNGQVRIEPATTSSSASEISSAFSSSTTSTLTATLAPGRLDNEGGLSAVVKAGIVVGVAVVALAALAVIGWCIVGEEKMAKSRNETSKMTPFDEVKELPDNKYEPRELPHNEVHRPIELEQPGGVSQGAQYS